MEISVLASGSSGNSTFVSTKETSVLVDAGISLRKIKRNLSSIGRELSEIDAILVTHEHIDHIKSIEKVSDVAPIFMTRGTFESARPSFVPKIISFDHPFSIGDMTIIPREISHDAAMPTGFEMNADGSTLGIFTDLGRYDQCLKDLVSRSDCMVLETNHDIDMVLNGNYPYHLKQRILGEKGHLSNIDAGILIRDNASDKLKNVFLSHISKNNNTPDVALDTFSRIVDRNKSLKMTKNMTSDSVNTELVKI